MKKIFLSIAGVALLSISNAAAVQYGFIRSSEANETNFSSDFTLDVTAITGGVQFAVSLASNTSNTGLFMGDLWFDTASGLFSGVLETADLVALAGTVDYKPKTSGAFPEAGSGFSPAFVEDQNFHATKNSSTGVVDRGESLGIKVDLATGKTLADVLAALDDGSLRLGIHVQGFSSGGSESYASNGRSQVPDSGSTLALFGLVLIALHSFKKKQG